MLDDNGDRQAEYWVYQLAANATVYTVWATINITALQYSVRLGPIYLHPQAFFVVFDCILN